MKYVITRDMVQVDYQSYDFWKQYDEIEVENPTGWYLRYVVGGIVHSFGYSQSSGRGEYLDEYREDVYKIPLRFTDDAQANAKIMHRKSYDNMRAMLIYEP